MVSPTQYKQRPPPGGATCGHERRPKVWFGDGSGRDSYILEESAGHCPMYKPYKYGNDLRAYQRIDRKLKGTKLDSSDYQQGWMGYAGAKRM